MTPQATAGLLQPQNSHGSNVNGAAAMAAVQRRGSRGAADSGGGGSVGGSLSGMQPSMQLAGYGHASQAAHAGHRPP